MIPRLYIYLALAVAAGGAYWYVHALQVKAARVEAAEAMVTNLQQSLRKANEASKAYQADLTRLSGERAKPLSVRLCRSPVRPPAAAAGSDAEAQGHVGEAAAVDIGPDIGDQLLEYGIDAEANALQLDRLQQWIRGR
jgi:hypothetical protein